jgi:hypothetical protein
VLFGAGQGTTLGSYAPRVSNFLATLAPDIGGANDQAQVAIADRPAPNVRQENNDWAVATPTITSSPWPAVGSVAANKNASAWPGGKSKAVQWGPVPSHGAVADDAPGSDFTHGGLYQWLKSTLAIVGLVAIATKLVKAAG